MREILVLFCVTTGIMFGSYEKLHKVMVLPDDEVYTTKDGLHIDLGIKYTVYQFFGLPLYLEEEAMFIGYLDRDNYLLFNRDIVKTIAELNNIKDIATLKQIPFRDKWGGKIVVIGLVLLLVVYIIKSNHSNRPTIFSCK